MLEAMACRKALTERADLPATGATPVGEGSVFVRLFASSIRVFVRSRPAMVITLAAAIVGTSAVGLAGAITTGLIYACVNNSSGTIHIVTPTTICATNEVALSWKTEGATGATGPAGPTGATGPSGATTVYTVRFGGMFPGQSVARAFCDPGEQGSGGGGPPPNPS